MPVTTRSRLKAYKKQSDTPSKVARKPRTVKSRKKNISNELSLKNLYIKKYKNGLKIESDDTKTNSLSGEPYVKLGNKWMYWNANMKCWFCSTTCEEDLIKGGAKWFSKRKSSNKKSSKRTKTTKNSSTPEQFFKDMSLTTYGKGYLLCPKKNHPDWGEKYYHEGWWMSTKKGWFFKKEYHNFLMINGAMSVEESESDMSDYGDEYDELDKSLFNGTVLKNYKNGLILKPKKSHPDWGEKYYHNGFWNGSLKSWVFKTDAKDFLVQHGAKLS